jgi:Domain of unknown function (DUF4372)/Transposase DDE domain
MMVNRFCSVFSQLLQLFPRQEFQKAVNKHRSDRGARDFRSWDHFVTMLFCQLAAAHSLREICGGLNSCQGKLAHLGLERPNKSTLGYANQYRDWQLFKTVFYVLLDQCQQLPLKKTFRFKNKLFSLDATLIELSLKAFPWAHYRQNKGAVKLHFTLDHEGYLPTGLVVTTGKRSELPLARLQKWEPGTIVVFDKGYVEFGWFWKLTQSDVFFVTRIKKFARYNVLEEKPVPAKSGVQSDQIIQYTFHRTLKKYPDPLRRIVFRTPEGDIYEYLTNNFDLAASTIASIYKDRWQIESFFKILKQNLRIKTFVGTSFNAVMIQIWTALIALLVLKYLQMKARFNWSMSNLAALLRMNLFVYRDLWDWLNRPFQPPPLPEVLQLQMDFLL